MENQEKESMIERLALSFFHKNTLTNFIVIIVTLAGILSFFSLGRLEDPEFTIKTAMVVTRYPGASPMEVEQEVSEPLEIAIQQIAELDDIRSTNRAGLSLIKVNLKESTRNKEIPQIWDILRKKILDASKNLPRGAETPIVADDFGQVYGHVLAITSDGHSYRDLENYAKDVKRRLSLVKDVSRVELWGEKVKVVYVNLNQHRLNALGLSAGTVLSTLTSQNKVVDVGTIKAGDSRLRMEVSGAFSSPKEIEELMIKPSFSDISNNKDKNLKNVQIKLKDIATIEETTLSPPMNIMRFNGLDSLAISISAAPKSNIVNLGNRLKEEVAKIKQELPAGINVEEIAWQGDLIDESINDFIINLIEALVIVAIVLTVSMGWRMGIVIGGQLLLTIFGTFIVMKLASIDMQRVSLGALIIAMGMMVDNAIVVAEGIFVRLQKGMDKINAIKETVGSTAYPLIGATFVAVLAFYPIYGNTSNVGEFCATMFMVIAISLIISWFLAILVAPLHTVSMINSNESGEELKESIWLQRYEKFLHLAIEYKKTFFLIMTLVLFSSFLSFKYVNKMFFPNSSRPQMILHYYGVEGTDIETVSNTLLNVEKDLKDYKNITVFSTFIGQGFPRFYLPMEPENVNPSYGVMIFNLKSSAVVQETYDYLNKYVKENVTGGLALVKKFTLGPGNTWTFEARFDGPYNADPEVLKSLAKQGEAILRKSPLVSIVRTDWREMVPKVKVDYSQKRGRLSKISRDDVINGLKKSFDGIPVDVYPENDVLLPIILRAEEETRENLENLDALQVYSSYTSNKVPLDDVIDNLKIEFEDPIIMRYNRHRSITLQTNPIDGITFPYLQSTVIDEFNKIKLPEGYSLNWDGEAKSSKNGQEALKPGIPPALLLMVLIVMMLFNSYRPVIIIFMTIPFVVIGLVYGLIIFNSSFGFVALLGAMSLSGMMIKNGIVLIDEIKANKEKGIDDYDAVILAAKSRLRPVVLAAGTTVLGCIPLIQDKFWEALAIVIMAGLMVGTVITMVFVPVLYACFYKAKKK